MDFVWETSRLRIACRTRYELPIPSCLHTTEWAHGQAMTEGRINRSHTHDCTWSYMTAMHATLKSLLARACVMRNGTSRNVRMFQSSLHFVGNMSYRSSLPDRTHNVRYEHDIYDAIQLSRWILQSIGIWHIIYGHSSQSEKLLSLMLIFMSFFGLCFVLVPAGSYFLFYDEDIESKIQFLGPVSFCLTSVIKYCFLETRISTIGKCIEHVESDWRIVQYQNHRRMMLRNVLIGRRITMLCMIFLYGGGLFYHTFLPLTSRTKTNGNFTSKSLIYPGCDQYFDLQASPAYEIIFCMHCLSAMIQYSATTAVWPRTLRRTHVDRCRYWWCSWMT